MSWQAQQLCRSGRHLWLTGSCGGLGDHTPLPSWMWVLFVVTTVSIVIGSIAYIALWLFMPRAGRTPHPGPCKATTSHRWSNA